MKITISDVTQFPRLLIKARVADAEPLPCRHKLGSLIPAQIQVEYRQLGPQFANQWEVLSLAVYGESRKSVWWPDELDEAPEWVQHFVADNMPQRIRC